MGEARQDGQQVVFDGNTESAAGFHHRKNGGDFGSGLRAAYMQPVLPFMYT